MEKVYMNIGQVIPYSWEGICGYTPRTDAFYKPLIRSTKKW